MDYIEVSFQFGHEPDYRKDLLIEALAEIGFETFEDTQEGFNAFVPAGDYQETSLVEVLMDRGDELQYTYHVRKIEAQNWNETWEKNFEPLLISDQCYVRATFHTPQPEFPYEIMIDPKMAFGTGHHETTTLMMQYLLETDCAGLEVLDMGAGTGILGILTAKRGAKRVLAIDYDPVCHESAQENALLNHVDQLTSLCGGKEVIPEETYDLILANINRNILLDQMLHYGGALKEGGTILFSGFYENPDLGMIREAAQNQGMEYLDHRKKGDWVAARFKKSNHFNKS